MKILRSLFCRKKRSVLSLLGIAIGVSSVLIISAVGESGSAAVSAELDGMGLNSILITHTDRTKPLTDYEINILQHMDMVDYVMPLTVLLSSTTNGEETESALLFGVDSGFGNFISLQIGEGRSFRTDDLIENSHCCIISSDLAKTFGNDAAIGQVLPIQINGNHIDFEIIGIANSSSGFLQSTLGSYLPTMIYVPYSALYTHFDGIANQQVAVRLKNKSDYSEKMLVAAMERFTYQSGAYQAQSLIQQQDTLNGILQLVTKLLTGIAGVALLVACLNIMTTMLVQVRERRREIGIKKAIGASNMSILMEFLSESVQLSGIGGLIGIGIAALCVGILRGFFSVSIQLSFYSIGVILLIALGSGALFGVYPAWRAARMDPICALRNE